MKTRLATTGVLLLFITTSVSAHQLDEYLQTTTLSVEKNRVQAQIRLTPGVAVFPTVIAGIDTNGDGAISAAEQKAYAERVLHDLWLSVDGSHLPLHLLSWKFASTSEMKEGRGDIQIEFNADVPRGGHNRTLVFENQHQSRIATYLVNCLVPRAPTIQVTAQTRNYLQSRYQMNYVTDGVVRPPSLPSSVPWRPSAWVWLGTAALLLSAQIASLWRQRGIKESVPADSQELMGGGVV